MEIKNISVGRKYTDKDGKEKTAWQNIGKLFIKDDGKMSLKIEMIPTNWDGGALVFDNTKNESSGAKSTDKAIKNDLPF